MYALRRLSALIVLAQIFLLSDVKAQQAVRFVDRDSATMDIMINGRKFTSYVYGNKLEKPVLYPLYTASGVVVTRGFPLNNRPSERTDHPHHVGLWFNYGDVNGLDFWNNSFDIPDTAKYKYGSIRHRKFVSRDPAKGQFSVEAEWLDHHGKVLLKETTTYSFTGTKSTNTVDRQTILTSLGEKVNLKDNKEGLLGLRVARELEMPAEKPEIFTDAKGNPTPVAVLNNDGVTGNYLTSEGKTGNAAWGTRAKWCMIHGIKNGEAVAIAIFDHPANPGYPTYWHARGYGLFAANNLGQEALSGGKETLNFSLEPGKSATFSHRIVIFNGKTPDAAALDKMAEAWGRVGSRSSVVGSP